MARHGDKASGHRRAPGQRQLRVGEELRHALATIFARGDLRDPVLAAGLITVTEVSISPDLRNATAYVMPLGGVNREETLAGLRRAAPYLRHRLASVMQLRYMPNLKFEIDSSFDTAERIDTLMRDNTERSDE
ncbi:MAG: 30S ribosome-binding factor RbfA [Alphaproteobacteria bacterium]